MKGIHTLKEHISSLDERKLKIVDLFSTDVLRWSKRVQWNECVIVQIGNFQFRRAVCQMHVVVQPVAIQIACGLEMGYDNMATREV